MADFEELSFVIPGYTPDTMPLDRLIEYLTQLGTVLGDASNLHLVDVKKSSVAPTFRVPREAAERAKAQARRVGRGEGTKVQTTAYNRLRKLVRRDARDAAKPALLRSAKSVVLEVPAAPEDGGVLSGVRQASQVDGELIRIGGDGDFPSLQMTSLDGKLLTGFVVKRQMVKEMARLIYEPIRVSGIGVWSRDEDGVWALDRMEVQSYELLDDTPLETITDRLHDINVSWPIDSIDLLLAQRGN